MASAQSLSQPTHQRDADIIIVEDDPYYFLQEGEYKPPSQRKYGVAKFDEEEYIANLVPTFLR
jgi:aromatic amino acid aminotransferase I